ncbi:MAG: hypothetical protein R3E86_05870 [Pseudomonadales bacterium]
MSERDGKLIASDQPLTDTQRATLARLLDLLIPASADGRMPAAADLDLYADLAGLNAPLLEALRVGLDRLETLAQDYLGQSFAALAARDCLTLRDRVRDEHPEFLRTFVVQSVARYYQHDRVMTAIGLEPRPPWPQGNLIEEGDWRLLDPVRARPRLYRD